MLADIILIPGSFGSNNMLALKEGIENADNKKILCALSKLRKVSKGCEINRKSFELLIDLIKMPNEKILNYALSILANCCLNDSNRKMLIELRGVPHIMIVIKSLTSSSIICRACRLIGNLAMNQDFVKDLYENHAIPALINLIEKCEMLTSDALAMTFRALKKIWSIAQFKWPVGSNDLVALFSECLDSEDEQRVQLTLETLAVITNYKNIPKKNKLMIDKSLFQKLISLSVNKHFNYLAILCLSNLICFDTSHVWTFLEGSKIAECYIEYLYKNDNVSERIYKAFYKLCTEGAIRSKVQVSGLLSKLINSCDLKNQTILLATFALFQYDLISMKICSENPKFVSFLINNIRRPTSIQILAVLSRLSPPVKELVLSQNLSVIISNKDCCGVLRNIASTTEFLKPIILSGKIWEIEKTGCKMENICSPGYVEYLLSQLLSHSTDQKSKEEASLATPFLVESRNVELLYKLLTQYQAMKTILDLLQKKPTEEKISATIVRLINIFKFNYHTPENYFQDFAGGEMPTTSNTAMEDWNMTPEEFQPPLENADSSKTVTFEFDDGECLDVEKNFICLKSPVLNSMLKGHFVEAQQTVIRLKNCTRKSFMLLVNYFNGENDFSNVDMETYMELLSLSDRFLLFELNVHLTENFKMNTNGCSLAYKWYRQAGHTVNNKKIGQKIYEFIFSSGENLYATMQDETCRHSLVNEISQYFSDSLRDSW